MKQKTLLFSWLLAMLFSIVGASPAWGDEVVCYTLTPSTNSTTNSSSYGNGYDFTISGITWNATGNTSMNPWRIGGKSLTNVNRAVYSKTAMGSAISKVELEVGSASSITVNSLKLIVASDASFNNQIDEVTKTFSANSTITFTPTSGTEWATGAYFKFVFNVTVSQSNNKFVEFKGAKFYYNAKSNPSLSVSPAVLELLYGDTESFTVSKSGDGALTVTSNNTSVATVAQDGDNANQYNVTYVGDGETTITVTAAETSTYAGETKTVSVTALDIRDAAGISYASAAVNAILTAGTYTQTLTNPNSLGVTYTSSNTDVATVASDGTVTLKTAGTTTITATFAGNGNYKPAAVSYTLTITAKQVADLIFNSDAIEKLTTDANFTNTWETDPENLGVNFTSSNTGVATVNATTGEVTIVGAGITTITATINDDDYEATEFTYTLTVSKADAPISFSSATAEVALDETESFVAPTLSNEQSLTITWTSSDETVATINSSGVISFLKAGTTTITATSTATAVYNSGAVSYTLTVTKAAENMPFAAAFSSTLGDFTVTADATLGNLWAINSSSAKASAYLNSKQNAGESWLISPYINISNAYATLSFDHADQYFNSESEMKSEATLWIREKGGDWEQLTIATYPSYTGTSKSSFVSTSNSLSSYNGKKVQIGFKYLGNTTKAGSWFVKNFRVADDREDAPISFTDATVYQLLKDKDTYTGQVLTNEESLTVSYASSNTDVATVNASTGVVSIKAAGETDITATYAETADYKANTATYRLVVTAKAAAAIEYAEAAVSKKITLGTYTHTLTNPNSVTVAYTSSDETVATVNASTGEVTMLKVGETTITATFTENEDYEGAAVSYTLTVIKDDPTLSFAKATVTADLADGTYTQAVTTTPADLPVTYSSSDETVATVASDGTATLLKEGSTTITATFAGNASYNSASTTYTLNVVIDYATLPFTFDNGKADIESETGLTQSGLGSDYSSKPYLKFDGTGDYVILKIAEAPGQLTFDIKGNSFSGGTFKVQTSADGETYDDLKSYTDLADTQSETFKNLASTIRYIKWIYTTKSSGNVALGNIALQKAPPATPTFSVEAGEYSEAKSVEISCATDGATIYYTTNGDTPTSSSTAYSSAINITTTTTLKAIAIKDEVESDVASATYTMNRPAAPTFDVEEGIFDEAFTLHLSAADGATIYYTTNGDTPTSSSTEYSDGVSIPAEGETTVKAIAVKNGLTSDVATAIYTYDTRPAPTFMLSATAIDLKVNETSSTVTLTTNSDGAVTFSCENSAVTLTGTGNSRTISSNAAGEYTVNVATAATSNYLAGAGTITVTVTKKATTMVLTPSFTSKDLYVTTSGSLTGAPQYNSSNIVGAAVTYSSSDETVATIAANGTVTFRKAGSTTITASYAGNDEYESCQATYVLDLTDSTPQETEVDITFGNALYGTSYTGANAAYTGPLGGRVNNIDIVVTQGSGANLYVTNSETRIYGGATKGTITISAPTGYVITKIVFNGGNKPSKWDLAASPGTLSSVTWTGSASTVVFSASSRSDLTTATVTLGSVVTLSSACFGGVNYYGTYSNGNAFVVPEGLRVSAITYNTTTKKIELDNYSTGDIVAAGEGVLVSSKTYGDYTVELTNETGTSKSGNLLVGTGDSGATASDMSDTNYYYYRLTMKDDKPGFWWKTAEGAGFALAANRAYLKVSKETAASARGFNLFNDEDETTGIHSIENGKLTMENGAWYTLGGQKMNGKPATKGIYIINGKKVVVK